MKPKEIFPTSTELSNNQEFYKKKILTYLGQKMVFDQDIRTGICYFCNKEGRPKRSTRTFLHHLKYDDSDPLAWTLELCGSCHYHVDINNKKIVDRYFYRKQQIRTAKYTSMRHNWLNL